MSQLYSHGDIELVLRIYVIGHNIKFGGRSRSRHDVKFMVEEKPCSGWKKTLILTSDYTRLQKVQYLLNKSLDEILDLC